MGTSPHTLLPRGRWLEAYPGDGNEFMIRFLNVVGLVDISAAVEESVDDLVST